MCIKNKVNVFLHDPLVKIWKEKNLSVHQDISFFKDKKINVIVFAVRHKEYLNLNARKIIKAFPNLSLIIDGFNVVNDKNAKIFSNNKIKIKGIGKAYWNMH